MAYDFELLAKKGKLQGFDIKTDPNKARLWFRDQAYQVRSMSVKKFQESATPFQNIENLSENSIGRMYAFMYDPKLKQILPYYDTFPLIFPLSIQKDRMIGMNLHYLPPYMRARLMDALYQNINNDKYDKTTKLQISYQILNGASQFKYFKPCVKMYLFDHVRSPFMNIKPGLWDYVTLLPLARFQKKSAEYVYFDSLLKTP